jgi:endoglucanase
MRVPAAPYHEAGVCAEAERICDDYGLAHRRDACGNLLVRLGGGRSRRPLVLAAHLDHPGFEILRTLGPRRWRARFLGGVPEDYFRLGLPLRLMPGRVAARLGRRLGTDRQFEVQSGVAPKAPPAFAVWELEDFALRSGRIHGRSCDDLIGVTTILATLIQLRNRRVAAEMIGVISRAEEVGFQGALTAGASGLLPKRALVISLETSRELPPAKIGAGVIIRVGDRSSIFDPEATRFLLEVATQLQSRKNGFRFQRALMSGGTCEATAYQELGFQTAALCVALGNYHNCAADRRIAAEFVSAADACAMVDLLVEVARQMPAYGALVGKLPARLRGYLRAARQALRSA